jgi:DNA-binding GntR family transcriptional regulator
VKGKVQMIRSIRGSASFKDQAVKLLSDRIMSGEIRPGERLNESLLSQQLGISRAPIREALQQLLEQGLVVNIPRRGMFVVSLGDEDVQKINSLRLVLESEALRLARAGITRLKVKKLAELLKKIEKAKPTPPSESTRLDMEFHRTIWSSAGNEYLEKTLTSLTAPLFAHRVVTLVQRETQELVLDTHRPIYDFVIGRSKQTAEEVMLTHLSRRWPDPARYSSLLSENRSPAITSSTGQDKERRNGPKYRAL